jgi:hypothetical protein
LLILSLLIKLHTFDNESLNFWTSCVILKASTYGGFTSSRNMAVINIIL